MVETFSLRELFSTSPLLPQVRQQLTPYLNGENNMKSMNIKHQAGTICALLIAGISIAAAGNASGRDMRSNHAFNKDGNILIADQFNNRVIETDPAGIIVR